MNPRGSASRPRCGAVLLLQSCPKSAESAADLTYRGRKRRLGIGNASGPVLWEHQFQARVEASAASVHQLLTCIVQTRAKNRTAGVDHRHWHHVQGMWQNRVHINLSSASSGHSYVLCCTVPAHDLISSAPQFQNATTRLDAKVVFEMQHSFCIVKLPGCGSLPASRLHHEWRHDASAAGTVV